MATQYKKQDKTPENDIWIEELSKKQLKTYAPSKASIQFWEKFFPKSEEVSLVDYLDAIVPVFQRDTGRKFNQNQLNNLAFTIDFEGRKVVNKYESMFFIDKVWNDLETQTKIWNERFIPIEEYVDEFKKRRNHMRSNVKAKASDSILAPTDTFKPFTLKDFLPPMWLEKLPHLRRHEYSLEVLREGPTYDRVPTEDKGSLYQGLTVDLVDGDILLNKKELVLPKTSSRFGTSFEGYSRLMFGTEKFCDFKFPEANLNAGSYHFTLEKYGNMLLMQDLARTGRVKFKVQKKPFVLDQGMVSKRITARLLKWGKQKHTLNIFTHWCSK